ncbi:aminotransferase class I/II-fold pyridoxal phosphate-dependent enzyme [Geotalea sp. SG265]|uniref:aminotransferase class I/II-fold pyridoxal phosphate-dependent enzyme n=1 Tax=Geotalea sp. SG265 TaxID=2922867 RepID=UPI001FAFFBFF|nr:aminotransferase class I/II-fold pyridoxal phosphate-dependent enzyme [Geotalea sp. SG265]
MDNKNCISDLAIFTGNPLFDEKLFVGRPNIGNRASFMERMNDIFDRRWFTNNGQYVQEFERKLADFIGVKHCIAMCNATVALEIVIRGLGLTGEVIVPSFTFVATPHSLQWQQITPVFCDIDPETHNLDPRRVEELITPRTTGIIGVHVWGRPCSIEALAEIAKRRRLKLLFDAAHAFSCSHQGRMIGSFGDAEVFSFHATKFFNTFEGGAVTTDNDELAAKIRLMKNFGFAGYDNVDYIGTNGKMTEVSAAMGLSSLEGLDGFIDVNRRNYQHYRQELADIPGIKLMHYSETEKCNYQYIILEIDETVTKINRDQLVSILHAENVLARRYFYPGCHQMEPYRSHFPHARLLLANTEQLASRVMSLPTGTAVSLNDVGNICGIIRIAVNHGAGIRNKLNLQG